MKILFIPCVAALFMAACSSGTSDRKADVEPRDSAAYNLGVQHGRRMLEEATDTSAMADMLLEVRARETDYRRRLRDSAADAYIAGFEDCVRDHNPSLAKYIFD